MTTSCMLTGVDVVVRRIAHVRPPTPFAAGSRAKTGTENILDALV